MNVYLVTSMATDKNRQGIILSVRVRFHGVYSDKILAEAIKRKYNGNITSSFLDVEGIGNEIVQSWENPGFVG